MFALKDHPVPEDARVQHPLAGQTQLQEGSALGLQGAQAVWKIPHPGTAALQTQLQ